MKKIGNSALLTKVSFFSYKKSEMPHKISQQTFLFQEFSLETSVTMCF
jgi:hypothetical protein